MKALKEYFLMVVFLLLLNMFWEIVWKMEFW